MGVDNWKLELKMAVLISGNPLFSSFLVSLRDFGESE